MRHRGKANRRDANEPEIIQALEQISCDVYQLDDPADLLVGYRARNFILEVKSLTGSPTADQITFARNWRGQYAIVRTPEQAIKVVTKSYGWKN